jgi:putative alpha-1,2-mannosidase
VGEDPTLEITSPLFDRITIDFPSLEDANRSERFEIVVNKRKSTDIYIQKVLMNGEALNGFEFPVSDFLAGGKLEIELGSSPPAL